MRCKFQLGLWTNYLKFWTSGAWINDTFSCLSLVRHKDLQHWSNGRDNNPLCLASERGFAPGTAKKLSVLSPWVAGSGGGISTHGIHSRRAWNWDTASVKKILQEARIQAGLVARAALWKTFLDIKNHQWVQPQGYSKQQSQTAPARQFLWGRGGLLCVEHRSPNLIRTLCPSGDRMEFCHKCLWVIWTRAKWNYRKTQPVVPKSLGLHVEHELPSAPVPHHQLRHRHHHSARWFDAS